MSIIIPTLNAADHLRTSLPPLARFEALDLVRELVIVDGGSADDTQAIADAAGATFIQTATGRGSQLACGAETASGDWLLFLHADTRLEDNWHRAIRAFIQEPRNSDRAGFFRFQLDDARPQARLLARVVALRARLFGLPFGDQGLLIKRDHYVSIGGFKPIVLMEDVDIVRRIGFRRLRPLPATAVTSADRYRREGYLLRPLRNLFCLILFFLGTPSAVIAKIYA